MKLTSILHSGKLSLSFEVFPPKSFENLESAYADGKDLKARENMLRASYLAGRAFTKSYVGYIHAVAHSLGGQYNIPHGLANAVLLPIGLEIYGKTVYNKG